MINLYKLHNNKEKLDYYLEYEEELSNFFNKGIYSKLESILHIIKKTPKYAYWYARDIIDGRWPEAESYIMKDPEYAHVYAVNIIKSRWEEAEQYIMKHPCYAYFYATQVIKDRWIEAEPCILKHKTFGEWYIDDVLRGKCKKERIGN